MRMPWTSDGIQVEEVAADFAPVPKGVKEVDH
jgi:hypothetical protein